MLPLAGGIIIYRMRLVSPKTILIAGLSEDAHTVGIQLLTNALIRNNYRVVDHCKYCTLDEIFMYAQTAHAILISTLNGHAIMNLSDFHGRKLRFEKSFGKRIWYIGGNLCINDKPVEIKEKLIKMGFTRAYPKFVSVDKVIKELKQDLRYLGDAHIKKMIDCTTESCNSTSVHNLKLDDNFYFNYIKDINRQWVCQDNISLEAIFASQKNIKCRFSDILNVNNSQPLIQPRTGVFSVSEQRECWNYLKTYADCLSIQIDSKTRSHQFNYIESSLQNGFCDLNGFPIINHGVIKCNELVSDFSDVPLQIRHGSADPRLLAAISFASGFTSFEGGAISHNLPYFKIVPIADSIRYWQQIDRLAGVCCENGYTVNREFFGALTATLVEPSIAIVVNVLEALLAAQQGVTNLSLAYAEQGNRHQDIATGLVLKEIVNHYLKCHGYNVNLNTVFHQYMAAFPSDMKIARLIIKESAVTAKLANVDRILVKTAAEALNIPSNMMNLDACMIVNQSFANTQSFTLNQSKINDEKDLIKLQVHQIMESIYKLGKGDLAVGVVQAFKFGYLDIPFSPSVHNSNLVKTVRDLDGAVRFMDTGKLQFSNDIKSFHRDLIEQRQKIELIDRDKMIEKDCTIIAENKVNFWPLDGRYTDCLSNTDTSKPKPTNKNSKFEIMNRDIDY